jgi:hypothetical protein
MCGLARSFCIHPKGGGAYKKSGKETRRKTKHGRALLKSGDDSLCVYINSEPRHDFQGWYPPPLSIFLANDFKMDRKNMFWGAFYQGKFFVSVTKFITG